MPVITEGLNLGDLLKYEAPNLYSRDQVTVAAGQNLVLGTVVGIDTATAKVKQIDPTATDGTEVAVGPVARKSHRRVLGAIGRIRIAVVVEQVAQVDRGAGVVAAEGRLAAAGDGALPATVAVGAVAGQAADAAAGKDLEAVGVEQVIAALQQAGRGALGLEQSCGREQQHGGRADHAIPPWPAGRKGWRRLRRHCAPLVAGLQAATDRRARPRLSIHRYMRMKRLTAGGPRA